MARRPTLRDVADAAGVGTATVDRVLNARGVVRDETARRVFEAAKSIGYHASALFEHRLETLRPSYSFGVVLRKPEHSFYAGFKAQLERAARDLIRLNIRVEIEFAASQEPEDVAEVIASLGRRVDALAAVAINHQAIDACIDELARRGVPTVSLLNDFAQDSRIVYLGLNNLRAGRTAGVMTALASGGEGEVAVFVGGHRWHGHELRETGFRSYLREYAPGIQILDPLVNLETRDLTYEATLQLIRRHPNLRGIYVAGGGMEGAIRAVEETLEPGAVTLVVNELTPESKSALQRHYVTLVCATPLEKLCATLYETLIRALDEPGSNFANIFLEPALYLPESI